MPRDRLRGFGRAITYNLLNPFAQLSRFSPYPKRTKNLRSVDDITFKTLSLPNSTSRAQMENQGSGNDAGIKETPVDDVWNVQRGLPNYQFATLPYLASQLMVRTVWADQLSFRMTSPYDPNRSGYTSELPQVVADVNIGTGTTSVPDDTAVEGAQVPARWFNYYAQLYKYYHVVATRWHLTLINYTTQNLYVHQYYSNGVDRPPTASNMDMLCWGDVYSHLVGPVAHAITSQGVVEKNDVNINNLNDEDSGAFQTAVNYETGNHVTSKGASNVLVMSGEYRTGDYTRDIHLDSQVENWSSTSANPLLPEHLHFRIRPQLESIGVNDTFNYNIPLKYEVQVKIEYLVEFKELRDGLKYPVATQPIFVTIDGSTRN